MSLALSTVGGFHVIASRADVANDAGRRTETVQFRMEDGTLFAVHPVAAIREASRLFSIKQDDPEWVLGPVDTARLKTLVDPTRRRNG